MSSDGLSDTEKVKLLFKNYMNYTSTESNQDFPNENLLSYHTNIFANNVLSEIPPKEPSYDIDVSNVETLRSILGNEFDFKIDGNWFGAKTSNTGSFTTDSSNIVLRLEKINLDYLEGGTSSFVCFDNCGNNILKNLIPQNYGPVGSPIYSLILYYDTGSKLVAIDWLLKSSNVRSQLGDSSIQFGAPLFDAKNGIITFYDVNGSAGSVFNDISSNFYLTATKYVGKVGTLDPDTITNMATNRNAIVSSQDISMSSLKTLEDLSSPNSEISTSGNMNVSGVLKCNGVEIGNAKVENVVVGDISLSHLQAAKQGDRLNSIFFTQNVEVEKTIYAQEVDATTVKADYIELNEISTPNSIDDISGRIRYYSDLYQVYTGQMWTGLSTHRTDQPPPLIEGSQTIQNSSIQISWTKFPEVYKDAVDGKSFPIYSFTFVDISDTIVPEWRTIYVGYGNYNPHTNKSQVPTTSITFGRNEKKVFTYLYDTTISFEDISFDNQPAKRTQLGYFENSYKFDLRIYGVNYSGRSPNYLFFSDLSLNPTDEPGPVTILSFSYHPNSIISMDVSFDLDISENGQQTISNSDIPIISYEISYNLLESKRFLLLGTPQHQHEQEISGNDSIYDLELLNLLPGAKYEIQIRAKNEIDGSYGDMGDISLSEFTHIPDSSYQYIDISALETVDASMTLDLSNASPIHCYVNNGTSLEQRTIANKNSFIDISDTTEFYVNYGVQGIDISNETSSLADVVFTKKKGGVNEDVKTLSYTKDKDLIRSVNFLGISFESTTYVDAGNDILIQGISKNKGFVYSSSFSSVDNIDISSQFTPSTSPYEVTYSVTGSNLNTNKELNHHQDLSINRTTSEFYYDDYDTTPTITDMNTEISANGSFLFGIPSVDTLTLTYDISVSNFASRIIPHDASGNHAIISDISGQGIYDFQASYVKDISSTSPYIIDTSVNSAVSSGYISTIDTSFTVSVYYLDHLSNEPTMRKEEQTIDVSINKIFKDSTFSYTSDISMYAFDGISMDETNMVEIDPSDPNFKNTYSSDISHMLLYFDGKFVSGGYNVDNDNPTPFQDWSDFALAGPNYFDISSTNVDNLKWISLEVPSRYIVNNNDVDLNTFQINGGGFWSHRDEFGNGTSENDIYEAYIYNDGHFGPLHTLRNIGDSTNFWYKANTATITNARTYYQGDGKYNGALKTKTTAFLNPSRPTGSKVYLVVGLRYNATHHFTFS
jgi:hypothetical protein